MSDLRLVKAHLDKRGNLHVVFHQGVQRRSVMFRPSTRSIRTEGGRVLLPRSRTCLRVAGSSEEPQKAPPIYLSPAVRGECRGYEVPLADLPYDLLEMARNYLDPPEEMRRAQEEAAQRITEAHDALVDAATAKREEIRKTARCPHCGTVPQVLGSENQGFAWFECWECGSYSKPASTWEEALTSWVEGEAGNLEEQRRRTGVCRHPPGPVGDPDG
jgi:hypothetical protein